MLKDTQHAILYQKQAIDSTPAGHANLPRWLTNLGTSYSLKFEHTGMLEDIQHAILYHQQALDFTSIGHADLPSCAEQSWLFVFSTIQAYWHTAGYPVWYFVSATSC